MQKITVLCVGKLKEAFYEQAVKEYEKRLSRCCKLELLELPEQRLGDEPSEAEIRQALKKEAALVEQRLSKGGALHLARVMLLEQIYRAYQIEAGTKYHK